MTSMLVVRWVFIEIVLHINKLLISIARKNKRAFFESSKFFITLASIPLPDTFLCPMAAALFMAEMKHNSVRKLLSIRQGAFMIS